jgi:hypothetical protein
MTLGDSLNEMGARGRWGGERHTEAQRAWTAIRRRRIAGASRGNEPIFHAGENRRTFGAPPAREPPSTFEPTGGIVLI